VYRARVAGRAPASGPVGRWWREVVDVDACRENSSPLSRTPLFACAGQLAPAQGGGCARLAAGFAGTSMPGPPAHATVAVEAGFVLTTSSLPSVPRVQHTAVLACCFPLLLRCLPHANCASCAVPCRFKPVESLLTSRTGGWWCLHRTGQFFFFLCPFRAPEFRCVPPWSFATFAVHDHTVCVSFEAAWRCDDCVLPIGRVAQRTPLVAVARIGSVSPPPVYPCLRPLGWMHHHQTQAQWYQWSQQVG
jgi:hypothetical protein